MRAGILALGFLLANPALGDSLVLQGETLVGDVSLGPTDTLTGFGVVEGRVEGVDGSTVDAEGGALTLGRLDLSDAVRLAGVATNGQALTLLNADPSLLRRLNVNEGALDAPNGIHIIQSLVGSNGRIVGDVTMRGVSQLMLSGPGVFDIAGDLILSQGFARFVAPEVTVHGRVRGSRASSLFVLQPATLGDPTDALAYKMNGTLEVSSELTLLDADWAELGATTELRGVITAPNGVAIPNDGRLTGSGRVDGAIWAPPSSRISSTSLSLSLGDANRDDGFRSEGSLQITTPGGSIDLRDRDGAELGPLTSIRQGILRSDSGFVLEPGDVIEGSGILIGEVRGGSIMPSGSVGRFPPRFDVGTARAMILSDDDSPPSNLRFSIGGGTFESSVLIPTDDLSGFGKVIGDIRNNGLVSGIGPSPEDFLELAGRVTGNGAFDGNIMLSGGLNVSGQALRTSSFENLSFLDTALLEMELRGTLPGVNHEPIDVSDVVNLGGKLDVRLLDGLTPNRGDLFQIVRARQRVGEFAQITGLAIGGGLRLVPIYNPRGLALFAVPVPEPSTFLLLLSGLIALKIRASNQARG